MKKLLLITALIFTYFNAFPGPVPHNKAQNVALSIYKKFVKGATIKNDIVIMDDSAKLVNGKLVDVIGLTSKKIINHYIFNMNPTGYIMISGDDRAKSIAAISTETNWVDPTKSNSAAAKTVAFYHESIKKSIHYIISNHIPATDKISKDWGNFSGEKMTAEPIKFSTSIPPLVHSLYNQSPYYNNYCPGGSVTGCVATAMQQIIRYWEYPTNGNSSYSYNEGTYGTLNFNFDSIINWNLMSLNLTASTPADSVNAVAMLAYELGISVAMDYSPSGSGAYVLQSENPGGPCSQYSYVNYFGYNGNTINGLVKSNFAIAKWDSIINVELTNNRPIQYVGFGSDGGHTWVLDGYESIDSLFHMNWGWGGLDNGYFVLDGLNPDGIPLGSESAMLVGIEPGNLNPCSPVTNFSATQITDTSTLLTWIPSNTQSSVNIEYQELGAPTWTTITGVVGNSYLLHGSTKGGLLTGTQYQVAVQEVCVNSGASNYTSSITFNTLGSTECPSPTPNTVFASSYYAPIIWNTIVGAAGYRIKYRPETIGSSWIVLPIVSSSTTTDTFYNLPASTWIQFGIQTICQNGDTSTYSCYVPGESIYQFYTYPPCGTSTNLVVDSSDILAGKISFTGVSGASYTLLLNNISNVGCAASECYLDNMFYNISSPTYLCPIVHGQWKYKIFTNCANGGSTQSSWGYFTNGSNYYVGQTTGLTYINLTSSSVTLDWTRPILAETYQGYLIPMNPFSQDYFTTSTNSISYTGLTPNSLYYYEVDGISPNWGLGPWSNPLSAFTTLSSSPVVCDTVSGITFTNITSSSATISWSSLSDSVYNLQYKTATSSTWNDIITTNTSYLIPNLTSATTYQVEIQTICSKSNTSGFTKTHSFSTSTLPIASISSHVNELCFGSSTGAATAIVTGGVSPYTYSWSTLPVQITATATGLAAGTYTSTVTDANGNISTATVIITQPTILTTSITSKNIYCYGNNTGTATVTATGGTSPYTYSWNTLPVQITATATGLAAGTYTSTVTDDNSCTKTSTVIITQPTALSVSTTQATNSSTATATGGTSPYIYSWNTNPVQKTATAIGLAAGTYTVTVTDANSCTKTAIVVITQVVCNIPTNISVGSVTTTGSTITWSSVTSDSIYQFQYRVSGATTWTTIITVSPTIILTGLVSNTTYQVQIASICSKNNISSYSNIITFATLKSIVTYCVVKGKTTLNYIKNVTIGSINNTTTNVNGGDGGYGNYTNLSTSLTPGQTYTIKLTPGFTNISPSPIKPTPINPFPISKSNIVPLSSITDQYWSVFIDYTGTGIFVEVVKGNSTTIVSGSFKIPTTAVVGATRMRIIDNNGSYINNACQIGTYSDFQDYDVIISTVGIKIK